MTSNGVDLLREEVEEKAVVVEDSTWGSGDSKRRRIDIDWP